MIGKIVISTIEEAYSKSFLEEKGIDKVISFIDPCKFDNFWEHYTYKMQMDWDYFMFYDVEIKNSEYVSPKLEDIQRLIDIYHKLINDQSVHNCLIHCTAGVSRSTAAAYILLFMMYGDKRKALDKLLEVRWFAQPNLLILDYADKILGTDLGDYIYKWRQEEMEEFRRVKRESLPPELRFKL